MSSKIFIRILMYYLSDLILEAIWELLNMLWHIHLECQDSNRFIKMDLEVRVKYQWTFLSMNFMYIYINIFVSEGIKINFM